MNDLLIYIFITISVIIVIYFSIDLVRERKDLIRNISQNSSESTREFDVILEYSNYGDDDFQCSTLKFIKTKTGELFLITDFSKNLPSQRIFLLNSYIKNEEIKEFKVEKFIFQKNSVELTIATEDFLVDRKLLIFECSESEYQKIKSWF